MSTSQLNGLTGKIGPRHRWGPVSPRILLRLLLLVLALVMLVVAVAACGNSELPAAAPTSAPAVPAPPPSSSSGTPAPTTAPDTTAPDTTAPESSGPQAGSGSTSEGTPPRSGSSPTRAAPHGESSTTPGKQVSTMWPAKDAAAARKLQQGVDSGREPWLLDPTEVAVSYAGVALNYRNPTVFTIGKGVIDVQDGKTSGKATLTLSQTVRRGDGGIWLVTGVRRR